MSLIYTGANIMAISLVTGTIRCIVGVSFHHDVEQFLMRIPNLFLFKRWVTNTSLIHSNEMTEVCFVLSECPDSYAEVINVFDPAAFPIVLLYRSSGRTNYLQASE